MRALYTHLVLSLFNHCGLSRIHVLIFVLFKDCSEGQGFCFPFWYFLIFLHCLNFLLSNFSLLHELFLLIVNHSMLLCVKFFTLFLEDLLAVGFVLLNAVRIEFSSANSARSKLRRIVFDNINLIFSVDLLDAPLFLVVVVLFLSRLLSVRLRLHGRLLSRVRVLLGGLGLSSGALADVFAGVARIVIIGLRLLHGLHITISTVVLLRIRWRLVGVIVWVVTTLCVVITFRIRVVIIRNLFSIVIAASILLTARQVILRQSLVVIVSFWGSVI